MKKFFLVATLVSAFAATAPAQVEGFGWDGQASEVVGRLGLGTYTHLEAGLGLRWDNNESGDESMSISASGRFLLALHEWEKLTGFLHIGGYFRDDEIQGQGSSANKGSFSVFAGYQPELLLIPHLALSIRFGALLRVMPDAGFALVGDEISIVQGLNFRILL
jgi:hypothetical protein